jgi:ABC-type Fe3+-hydroxamate transport system, periplasmic component
MINRPFKSLRRLVGVLAFGLFAAGAALAAPVTVTDIMGREVTLPAPAKRIILAQGRQLNALGLIHPDPISLLVGWGSDYKRQNSDAYARHRDKFPAIDSIPNVGDGATPAGFSLEKAVTLAPDLVIFNRSIAESSNESGNVIERLEAAGIPVVVIDFFLHPLQDTVPSLRILGRLLGREDQAESYIHFYEERRQRISSRLESVSRPSVFMHAHAGGYECCQSPGQGTFNDFIMAVGGRNIAAALLPGATGQISLERLVAEDPDVYIATGGTHLTKSGGLVLGLGISHETAAQSFAAQLSRPGINMLSAIESKRAYGLWHLFNDTPMHIVAIELLAKWIHPEIFADIDPQSTWREISTRFSAIPLDGTFWIDPAENNASPAGLPSKP